MIKPQRGFTLIEVLLVVVLIGILSGLVLFAASPADPSRVLMTETDRLQEALSLAIDRAVDDNEQYGLLVEEHRYRFMVYDLASKQWLPAPNTAFADYDLPDEVTLRVLEDTRKDSFKLETKSDKKALTPQVLMLSSGETSNTALELAIDSNKQRLVLDDLGNISRPEGTQP